jgi:hypothetical protein
MYPSLIVESVQTCLLPSPRPLSPQAPRPADILPGSLASPPSLDISPLDSRPATNLIFAIPLSSTCNVHSPCCRINYVSTFNYLTGLTSLMVLSLLNMIWRDPKYRFHVTRYRDLILNEDILRVSCSPSVILVGR